MHETAEDLGRLQRLLDDSYASAGEHLLSIHTSVDGLFYRGRFWFGSSNDWSDWGGSSPYALIEPRRMFTFWMQH